MESEFVELKSTDGQVVYVRPQAVGALEVVPASARVDGHIKVYVGGFKFLIQADPDELLGKLSDSTK
jgi:hypothetical protein